MANNYLQSSSMLALPKDKHEAAAAIVARVTQEFEESEDGYADFCCEVEPAGVWIYGEESISPEHVVVLVQTLLDELEIDEPFIFDWAYTCSKMRVDEFGGGSCGVRRGMDPVWCDARSTVEQKMLETPADVWGEDAAYPRADWKHEVANDDTNLGYWAWVAHMKEQADE